MKEQLGHSSIEITVDIYGHLIPGSNREAVNRLDNPQQSETYPQPAKIEKPQPSEITANSISVVPKAGLEAARHYGYQGITGHVVHRWPTSTVKLVLYLAY